MVYILLVGTRWKILSQAPLWSSLLPVSQGELKFGGRAQKCPEPSVSLLPRVPSPTLLTCIFWATLSILRTTFPCCFHDRGGAFQKHTQRCTHMKMHGHRRGVTETAKGLLCWAEHMKFCGQLNLPLPHPSNCYNNPPPWLQQPAPALEQGWDIIESRAGYIYLRGKVEQDCFIHTFSLPSLPSTAAWLCS